MTTQTKTQIEIEPAGSFQTKYSRGYKHSPASRVTWTFPDGVEILAIETQLTTTYPDRGYSRSNHVDAGKKCRVHVETEAGFNLVEDLTNRTRRPHTAWKPRVVEALGRIGVEFDYLGWSQYAGCSSCPCSPGFVPRDPKGGDTDGWTFWVKLPNAPTVDERRAPRDIGVAD